MNRDLPIPLRETHNDVGDTKAADEAGVLACVHAKYRSFGSRRPQLPEDRLSFDFGCDENPDYWLRH